MLIVIIFHLRPPHCRTKPCQRVLKSKNRARWEWTRQRARLALVLGPGLALVPVGGLALAL